MTVQRKMTNTSNAPAWNKFSSEFRRFSELFAPRGIHLCHSSRINHRQPSDLISFESFIRSKSEKKNNDFDKSLSRIVPVGEIQINGLYSRDIKLSLVNMGQAKCHAILNVVKNE